MLPRTYLWIFYRLEEELQPSAVHITLQSSWTLCRPYTYPRFPGVLHPACAHAALCSTGLPTPARPSEPAGDVSSCKCFPGPVTITLAAKLCKDWFGFRCSVLRAPEAHSASLCPSTYPNHMVTLFIGLSCWTDCHFPEGRVYLSSNSQCLEKCSIFRKCSINVLGNYKWMKRGRDEERCCSEVSMEISVPILY